MNMLCAIAVTLAACASAIAQESPYYELVADNVAPDDVAVIQEALDHGIAQMIAYFDSDPDRPDDDEPPVAIEPLLRELDVTITIHAEETDRAGPGHATTISGTRDGSIETYFAEIHLLAPSAHPRGITTSSNEPKDDIYFQRLVVHEYSTVFFELVSRSKPKGWPFRQAPSWFVQGYQEYFGLTRSGEGPLKRSLPRYIEIVRAEPDRVTNDFGFDVRDPYITGAVLLHFMHEHFGAERLRAVLRSEEPTFGRAMRKHLGVDADTFMDAWTQWLRSQPATSEDRPHAP